MYTLVEPDRGMLALRNAETENKVYFLHTNKKKSYDFLYHGKIITSLSVTSKQFIFSLGTILSMLFACVMPCEWNRTRQIYIKTNHQ